MSRLGKYIDIGERFVDISRWEMGECRMIASGSEVYFWGEENILKLGRGDGFATW